METRRTLARAPRLRSHAHGRWSLPETGDDLPIPFMERSASAPPVAPGGGEVALGEGMPECEGISHMGNTSLRLMRAGWVGEDGTSTEFFRATGRGADRRDAHLGGAPCRGRRLRGDPRGGLRRDRPGRRSGHRPSRDVTRSLGGARRGDIPGELARRARPVASTVSSPRRPSTTTPPPTPSGRASPPLTLAALLSVVAVASIAGLVMVDRRDLTV